MNELRAAINRNLGTLCQDWRDTSLKPVSHVDDKLVMRSNERHVMETFRVINPGDIKTKAGDYCIAYRGGFYVRIHSIDIDAWLKQC